jgi:hypothetical protein
MKRQVYLTELAFSNPPQQRGKARKKEPGVNALHCPPIFLRLIEDFPRK